MALNIFHYRTITIPGTESIFSCAFMQSNIINKKILSLQRSRNIRPTKIYWLCQTQTTNFSSYVKWSKIVDFSMKKLTEEFNLRIKVLYKK